MSAERPAHLTPHNAATFQLPGVVANYHLRTPYAPALADALCTLMRPTGGAVLELGCGTGEIARMLAPRVARIDAIDISAPMLGRARTMPGGAHPHIHWTLAAAENAPLDGPYALAVAGDALHWMQWEVVLPRIAAALAPNAVLAIVTAAAEEAPWSGELLDVIPRYSTMQDFERYVLAEQLERRGLFRTAGERTLDAMPYTRQAITSQPCTRPPALLPSVCRRTTCAHSTRLCARSLTRTPATACCISAQPHRSRGARRSRREPRTFADRATGRQIG